MKAACLLNWGNLQAWTYLTTPGTTSMLVKCNHPYWWRDSGLSSDRNWCMCSHLATPGATDMLVKCNHPYWWQDFGVSSDRNWCSHLADCARSADNWEPMSMALSVDLTQSTRWLQHLWFPRGGGSNFTLVR